MMMVGPEFETATKALGGTARCTCGWESAKQFADTKRQLAVQVQRAFDEHEASPTATETKATTKAASYRPRSFAQEGRHAAEEEPLQASAGPDSAPGSSDRWEPHAWVGAAFVAFLLAFAVWFGLTIGDPFQYVGGDDGDRQFTEEQCDRWQEQASSENDPDGRYTPAPLLADGSEC